MSVNAGNASHSPSDRDEPPSFHSDPLRQQPSWIADLIHDDPFQEPMMFPYHEPTGFSMAYQPNSLIGCSTMAGSTTGLSSTTGPINADFNVPNLSINAQIQQLHGGRQVRLGGQPRRPNRDDPRKLLQVHQDLQSHGFEWEREKACLIHRTEMIYKRSQKCRMKARCILLKPLVSEVKARAKKHP